ncbi:unnamed protein product [Amaranthus hypochondriacus]
MADFAFLSDTDESAVEQILAEAMDHCVLQQVAAINCSSFSQSVLPSDLESRFQRLKTFPSSSSSSHPSKSLPKSQLAPDSANESNNSLNNSAEKEKHLSGNSRKPLTKEKVKNSEGNSRSGYLSSPSGSSNSSFGQLNSPKLEAKKDDKKGEGGKFLSRSLSFSSNSSTSSSTKKAKTGCFWCSPKQASKKKSCTQKGMLDLGDDWGKHDELLSDLKSFSSKKQKNLMKIAKKEEMKINKEAEKIIKWAKQASARMEFSGFHDDDLSDDDDDHSFGLH